ncbi:DUF2147 domain-containing protein [Qipengyuania nanhaisediminis]|uniref:Uncharacterized conserved protein, DUF2147 family n=1 Tax=Qipengyuania nanhaisediminis TaxID=604088 RepID=A0A1I5KJN4_9SPHN|nr:DUF2147 domain-containing protein [Qipengyuania nanhaisediminis]SFO85294.1 Uncharacterized conserved protein, DUF2147 family [Qipengyuania nanhaisediminis]
MKRLPLKRLAAIAALASAAPLLAAQPIEGRWVTAEKDAVIQIGKCGSKLCGKIARFLVAPPQGLDQRDVNNKEPRLRSRKLLGMPVLTGFNEESDLWRGEIYDPKSGKTYRSVVRRKDANRLEVKGCIGPFCQTQVWTRAR